MPPLGTRLRACADRCLALEIELQDERQKRDELVVDAVDAGWNWSQVSRWARVSRTRVRHIVAELG